jgi:CheY-like chemotaxis protein
MDKRILLVEDDAAFREVFKRALGGGRWPPSTSTSRSSRLARWPRPACGLGRAVWTLR